MTETVAGHAALCTGRDRNRASRPSSSGYTNSVYTQNPTLSRKIAVTLLQSGLGLGL